MQEKTDFEKLIDELEVDVMVFNVQSDSQFVHRLRKAIQALKALDGNRASELEQLKDLIRPILKGDMHVVPAISISWINDAARQRMREALQGSKTFREKAKQIISIEGSVP